MKKSNQLFIRACKSKDPIKRLRTLYYRLYGANSSEGLSLALMRISSISAEKLMKELDPQNPYLSVNNHYWENVLLVLMYDIRYTRVDLFIGLTTPAHLRNK